MKINLFLYPLTWVFLHSTAIAGCGGLSGKTLEDCREAEMKKSDRAHRSLVQNAMKTPVFIEHGSKIIVRTLLELGGVGDEFEFACSQNAENGVYKIYSSTAAGYASVTCKEGRPDGVASLWLPCGFMSEERHYKLGRLDGPYSEYHNCTDNILRSGQFVDGVQDGKWVGFRNDNSLHWEQVWRDGKVVSYVYHPNIK